MEGTKFTITIEAEALSIDVFQGLTLEALDIIRGGNTSGSLTKDDGDQVAWSIKAEKVKF